MILRLLAASLVVAAALRADPEPAWPQRAAFGMNLGTVAWWSSNTPFADAMKTARPWRAWEGTAPDGPERSTPRGEPAPLAGEDVGARVLNSAYPPGRYTLAWEGVGTARLVALDAAARAAEVEAAPGRVVYDVTPGAFAVRVQGAVRAVRLWLPGLEGAASPYLPAWVDTLRPFGGIRFMNFMDTNGSAQERWEDRPLPTDTFFFDRGVPLEWMLALCNELGAEPWFCMPERADDAYVRAFARMVRDGLRPDLHVTVEYSNETFNHAFTAFRHAVAQGRARGLDADGPPEPVLAARFVAERSVEMFRIWREEFGTDAASRVRGVVTFIIRRPEREAEALALATWRDAHREIDAFATAPYIGVGLQRRLGAEALHLSAEDMLERMAREQATQIVAELERAHAVARRFNKPLLAYEGGEHLSQFGGGVDTPQMRDHMRRFIPAYARHPGMEALVRGHLEDWFRLGGGRYYVFAHMGAHSEWGSFSHWTRVDQPLAEAPKRRAVFDLLGRAELPAPAP